MTPAHWATLLPVLAVLAALLPAISAARLVRAPGGPATHWGAIAVHVLSTAALLALAVGLARATQAVPGGDHWQLGASFSEATPLAVFREPARSARAAGVWALVAGALTAVMALAPGPRAGRLLLGLLGAVFTTTLLVRRVHLASLEVIVGPQVVTLRSAIGAQQVPRARIVRAQAFSVTARNMRRSPVTRTPRDENIGAPTVRGLRFVDAAGAELFALDEEASPPPDALAELLGIPIDDAPPDGGDDQDP